MKRLWLKLKRWWLKRRLRALYYRAAAIKNDYDCGHAMLREMSPSYYRVSTRMDELLTRCKAIDVELGESSA